MKKKSKPDPLLSVRLTPAMNDALDAEVARRQAEHPGTIVNRSDVARSILEKALFGK